MFKIYTAATQTDFPGDIPIGPDALALGLDVEVDVGGGGEKALATALAASVNAVDTRAFWGSACKHRYMGWLCIAVMHATANHSAQTFNCGLL